LPRYLPSRFSSVDSDERVALSCEEFLKTLRAPSDLGVPLLIFDQFEELVTLFEENPKSQERFKQARAARETIEQLLCELLLNDPLPLKIVFAFRDDYLARLGPLFSRIPNLVDQGLRLALPSVERLEQIIRGPFVRSEDGERGLPGQFPDELSEELAEKIAVGIRASKPSGLVNLSEVQTLCLALWRQPERRDELLHAADPPAVLQKIIESEAMDALNNLLPWDRVPAIALLSNLVTAEGTRDVVSEENVISETRRNPLMWLYRGDWTNLLHDLPDKTGLLRRSLSSGTTYYELASEFLISWIQKQQQALRRQALMIWGYLFAGLLVLLVLLVVLATMAFIEKGAVQRALLKAETATRRAEAGETKAKEAKAEADKNRADLAGALQLYIQGSKLAPKEIDRGGDDTSQFQMWLARYARDQGEVLLADGNLQQAKQRFLDALYIAQKLVRMDSGNAVWQHDLSVSYQKVGDVQFAQGQLAGALKSYRDSLGIAEKLATQDPSNARWQSDLALLYLRIGFVWGLVEPKSQSEAQAIMEKGRDILRQLPPPFAQ
jgi:tetratricopeptide (TPR) repeat protein